MSNFVEVKTAELTGPALDWAVAKATGETLGGESIQDGYILVGLGVDGDLQRKFSPSTEWSQGGPLRDSYDVGIEPGTPNGPPYAYVPGRDLEGSFGETALIALCRAIVAAKLGDVVQVPKELIGGIS